MHPPATCGNPFSHPILRIVSRRDHRPETTLESTVSGARAARPPRPRNAQLVAAYPPEVHYCVRLGGGAVVVGRGEHPLEHETVSRQHFAVTWDGERRCHLVVDRGSRNGTWVNDRRLGEEAVPLGEGDVIRAGDVLLVYECGAGVDLEGDGKDDTLLPGQAASMRLLRAAVSRAAPDPAPALLIGETGTGKEWLARALHERSGRKGPLVAVNCAALGAQLIESQLFGHVKGAFTGAVSDHEGLFREAEGGTLFLDEIGELPLELQPKLLRAIQEREVRPVGGRRALPVDVRIVAATNRDLAALVDAGGFRRDLYARLAMWELRVPPLRSRRADLFTWLSRLARRRDESRGASAGLPPFEPGAAHRILMCAFRENLRGLERLVHELATAGLPRVGVDDLPPWVEHVAPAASASAEITVDSAPHTAPRVSAPPAIRPEVPDREVFAAAFETCHGSVRALARHFARDRRQIYRWIEKYGLAERRKS